MGTKKDTLDTAEKHSRKVAQRCTAPKLLPSVERWRVFSFESALHSQVGVCVVAGNVRRTAEIAFGDPGSEEYIDLKNYDKNPNRSAFGWASNNSVLAKLGMDYAKVRFWMERRIYARRGTISRLGDERPTTRRLAFTVCVCADKDKPYPCLITIFIALPALACVFFGTHG